jgi:lipopolysaccharide export system permease protein
VNILSRYVLREAFGAWLVVTGVLFLILMSNQLAAILSDAAANRLPRDAVFAIFGLTSLRYLVQLTPIAVFLGVMLALARLNRDGEMSALAACGIGPGRLLVPIGGLALALAVSTGWLALVQTPVAVQRIEAIKLAAADELEIGVIEAGKFTSPDSGATILHAREVEGDTIRDVFLKRREGERVVVMRAERGERGVDPESGELSFRLFNGRSFEGVPGERAWWIASFRENNIPVRPARDEEPVEVVAAKTTRELLRSSAPVDRAELQWRLSVPISVVVLAILAVPLTRSSPREGRYARLGIGLLIYITYQNALAIARVWVEDEVIPTWLGVWWVHGVLLGFAALLLARASGFGVRAPQVEAGA